MCEKLFGYWDGITKYRNIIQINCLQKLGQCYIVPRDGVVSLAINEDSQINWIIFSYLSDGDAVNGK